MLNINAYPLINLIIIQILPFLLHHLSKIIHLALLEMLIPIKRPFLDALIRAGVPLTNRLEVLRLDEEARHRRILLEIIVELLFLGEEDLDFTKEAALHEFDEREHSGEVADFDGAFGDEVDVFGAFAAFDDVEVGGLGD